MPKGLKADPEKNKIDEDIAVIRELQKWVGDVNLLAKVMAYINDAVVYRRRKENSRKGNRNNKGRPYQGKFDF